MTLNSNLRGAMFMAIAMAGFTGNDAIAKFAAQSMNMGEVMVIRGLFASIFVAALAWHRGALRPLVVALHPLLLLRVFCEVAGTITFLLPLAHMPLANVSAVLQALPLAVTMGAALVFAEPVGWRRWLAIAVGFAGVMVIVRPGFGGFNVYALMVLACVGFCAVRDLATKRIPREIPTLYISTMTAVGNTVVGVFLIAPLGGWTAPSGESLALLACGAVLLIVGYQFIIGAMRVGEISFIAPFRYTALLWAIALGIVVFGDWPDLPMGVGAAIIVASGLYALYRERVVGRSRVAAESSGQAATPEGL